MKAVSSLLGISLCFGIFTTIFVSVTSVTAAVIAGSDDKTGIRVYRYDVNDILNPFNYTANLQTAQPIDDLDDSDALASELSESGPPAKFQIRFSCTDAPSSICTKAQNGFEAVARRMSEILLLRSDIVIRASFRSLCESQSECRTLGQAGSAAFFSGKNTRSASSPIVSASDIGSLSTRDYLYPQSLIKQFRQNVRVEYYEYDIIAEFNSDANFWFEGDGPIGSNQYDFQYVVLHEILHGVFMLSAWRNHFAPFLGSGAPSSFLIPPPVLTGTVDNPYFEGWDPLFVFDAYLQEASSSTRLNQYADTIFSNTVSSRTPLADFFNAFTGTNGYTAARTVFNRAVTASPSLKFVFPSVAEGSSTDVAIGGEAILFTTANRYLPSSSISHLDFNSYSTSSDFLMRPYLENGTTLASLEASLSNGWKYGAVGPRIARMMQAVGYTLADDPVVISAGGIGSVDVNSIDMGAFTFSDTRPRIGDGGGSSSSPAVLTEMRWVGVLSGIVTALFFL